MWLALFKILYWLIVGSIPFFPIYLNQRLLENMDCPYGSDCFGYAMSFIPAQTNFLIISSLLLWPLVILNIWKIIYSFKSK
jgi:hypothetical protein